MRGKSFATAGIRAITGFQEFTGFPVEEIEQKVPNRPIIAQY
jgi:hypothetical protein